MLTFAQRLRIFLLFLLAGPPLGALPLALLFMLVSFTAEPAVLALGFGFLIFSYPFGLLPAGLAGILFLLAVPSLQATSILPTRHREFVTGALCGFLAAGIFSFMLVPGELWSSLLFFVVPGLVGGGVCGQLSKRLLQDPSSGPQITKEAVKRWGFTFVVVAVFFGALTLVSN